MEKKKERKKEERLGPCNSASALVPIPKSTLVVCIYKVEHTCGWAYVWRGMFGGAGSSHMLLPHYIWPCLVVLLGGWACVFLWIHCVSELWGGLLVSGICKGTLVVEHMCRPCVVVQIHHLCLQCPCLVVLVGCWACVGACVVDGIMYVCHVIG